MQFSFLHKHVKMRNLNNAKKTDKKLREGGGQRVKRDWEC